MNFSPLHNINQPQEIAKYKEHRFIRTQCCAIPFSLVLYRAHHVEERKEEWPREKRLILKSLHFLPFYFLQFHLVFFTKLVHLTQRKAITEGCNQLKRKGLRIEMENESFHVEIIKTFAVELQLVEMTTHRPLAINLWCLKTE